MQLMPDFSLKSIDLHIRKGDENSAAVSLTVQHIVLGEGLK